MSSVHIQNLSKSFKTSSGTLTVLKNVNLHIREGEFITIIGPSGCGKSTLLKMIAGLDNEHEGSIMLGDQEIKGPSIEKGFIFQEHRLFPWLTVEQNIAANLSLKQPAVRAAVDKLIQLVRLKGFESAYPRQLSGGMSQRVAIARALLRDPQVLLLDEPFAALDAFTRSHMQEAMIDIWTQKRTTMILVTHDIDEAIVLANRVVIMEAKPGTVRTVIHVDLPYPRKRVSPEFQELRMKVIREFEQPSLVGSR